jgi:hypothetical protein
MNAMSASAAVAFTSFSHRASMIARTARRREDSMKKPREAPSPPPEKGAAVVKKRKPVAPVPPMEGLEGGATHGLEPHYHETTQHAPKLHEHRSEAIAPTARSQQRRFPR